MTQDVCIVCGKALNTYDTIWAAQGYLYCSDKCVEDHLTNMDLAEELSPVDIGITGGDEHVEK